MCYLNGTTDRTYTGINRQAAHKYGEITLQADDGRKITEVFRDYNQQVMLEGKFKEMRQSEFDNQATVYITFRSRMDTRKARAFLEDVAEKVGFRMEPVCNRRLPFIKRRKQIKCRV